MCENSWLVCCRVHQNPRNTIMTYHPPSSRLTTQAGFSLQITQERRHQIGIRTATIPPAGGPHGYADNRELPELEGFSYHRRTAVHTICVENGYSIAENPKGKGKSYDKWLGDQKKSSHRELICYAIDEAIAQNPSSFEELLEQLRCSGYQVKGGKVPALLGEGQKRFIRMDTLGAGYTPDDLRAIIAGTKAHTPKKKRVMCAATNVSGSLLIDIQAKLQEGNRPIVLREGQRLGQLVFARMMKNAMNPYNGKYQKQTGATGSRIYLDYNT